MTPETADEFDPLLAAFEGGKRFAAIDEAERQLAIYTSPEAIVRPMTAWGFLPAGLSVADTLALLREYEVEQDTPPDIYHHHTELLKLRLQTARAAHELWERRHDHRH